MSAAKQNAIRSLQTQVDTLQIAPGLTVGSFLEQTDTVGSIKELEDKAPTLGGPRWIDDQTVQMKVELPGNDLVSQLVSIAATHPNGPIGPGALEQRLRGLKRVSLIGTGTSLASNAVPTIRPPGVSDAWANVSDADRSHAVSVAREEAEQRVLADIAPVPIATEQTAGDLLKRPAVGDAARKWLSTRPVSDVQFKDDLQVQLTVSAPRHELLQTILGAARNDGVKLDDRIETMSNEAAPLIAGIGHASAGGATPLPSVNPNALPDQPPSWTAQPIDAQGVGPRERTPLRTKSAAEADATEALRAQIKALRLDQNRTLGDLAKSDPRIDSAISSALLRAHVYKVEWRADGTAMVRITLDTRDLWDELTNATH